MFTKIIVCCPAGLVTGGAELLHQLVHVLRSRGVDSKILYYPFSSSNDITAAYSRYDIEVSTIDEIEQTTLIVLPETATSLKNKIKHKHFAIWWMSIDNYFGYARSTANTIERLKHFIKIVLGKTVAISQLRKFIHFHQSEYARLFLLSKNIKSVAMSDYLNQSHMTEEQSAKGRERIVAYNPKKGTKITQKIIAAIPDVKFQPLINMTAKEVQETLAKSMVYIDFGNHPGKDRFPREAALAGCVVITGKQGSAANNKDIPIPARFKVGENSPDFLMEIRGLILGVLSNYQENSSLIDNYRKQIREEEKNFKMQVDEFIAQYINT